MARILCTGNVTLDIINTVDHYPLEDEELRATRQSVSSGGNAANTALVLAQLRQDVYLSGVVANDPAGRWLKDHLRMLNVNVDHLREQNGSTPTSYITLNAANGSRTIVHHRQLEELAAEDFSHVALERIDWFHFEGRNVQTLEVIMERTLRKRVDQPVSLELEKPRQGLDDLATRADVLLFSRVYARSQGFDDGAKFLAHKQRCMPDTLMFLAWGESGAWCCGPRQAPTLIPSTPLTVVDTVGAGDTFNAGVINALVNGYPLAEAATAGCRLAERKIAHVGLLPPLAKD